MWTRMRGDTGQVVPLMVLVVVVALAAVVVVSRVTLAADDAARAQTAADAAALAGATGGRSAATTMAIENGARLMTFDASGATVEVVVEVGGPLASARAELIVDWVP
ncbi:MAG: pilus assembly protein TadG-related protein [Actinomycetota bacterium]